MKRLKNTELVCIKPQVFLDPRNNPLHYWNDPDNDPEPGSGAPHYDSDRAGRGEGGLESLTDCLFFSVLDDRPYKIKTAHYENNIFFALAHRICLGFFLIKNDINGDHLTVKVDNKELLTSCTCLTRPQLTIYYYIYPLIMLISVYIDLRKGGGGFNAAAYNVLLIGIT